MSTKYLGNIKDHFINAVGTELCWGWSPAVDFVDLLSERISTVDNNENEQTTTAKNKDVASKNGASATSKKKKQTVTGFDEDGFPIVGDSSSTEKKNDDDDDDDEQKNNNNNKDDADKKNPPINILLLGACDVRHVVMTLARMRRTELGRSKRPVHFYIFEPSLRVHCRHLLFLQLLLVDLVTLSELEDRVSVVLEIFGNSLLRDFSAAALKNAALAVSAALDHEEEGDDQEEPTRDRENDEDEGTQQQHDDGDDGNDADKKKNNHNNNNQETPTTKKNSSSSTTTRKVTNTKLASWLDWSLMKNKERDFVASQLLLWTRNRTHVDIVAQWDQRVRTELAERYDNRVNIFDWDFHFSLLDYSNLLRFPEYREFRKIGQAFDYCRINPRRGFRYDYTVPNKSLAQFNARTGTGVYLGDVKNGPFFAIGHDIENPHLKKREVDGTTIYGCGVIAMHTVRSWLYELVTGKIFPTDTQHKHAWDDDKNYNMLPENAPEPHIEYQPEVSECKFFMVGLDIEKFCDKIAREHGEFFDAAFVGSTCTHWMDSKASNFFRTMKSSHGVVVAETLKFVVDARDDAKLSFEKKIVDDLAKPQGWVVHEKMTGKLHLNQNGPKPRTAGVELDASSKKAIERSKFHHQVVLVKQQ